MGVKTAVLRHDIILYGCDFKIFVTTEQGTSTLCCLHYPRMSDECCYNLPQFFSSIPVTPVAAPPPAPTPPAVQPILVQPVAPPQPYIRTQPPSPMQVDPANVPLSTPSTDSDMLPPDQLLRLQVALRCDLHDWY